MVDIDGPNIFESCLNEQNEMILFNNCDEEHFFFSPFSIISKTWIKDNNTIDDCIFNKNYRPLIKKIHIL